MLLLLFYYFFSLHHLSFIGLHSYFRGSFVVNLSVVDARYCANNNNVSSTRNTCAVSSARDHFSSISLSVINMPIDEILWFSYRSLCHFRKSFSWYIVKIP